MKPHFGDNDLFLFYKYLQKCSVYFEYGSGGSTYQASIRDNIECIYSVESDIQWQKKLEQTINTDKITYFFNEMNTKPNTWGNPGPNSTPHQKKKYSSFMQTLSKNEQNKIDFVLIDGRFRVACCLKCFDIINETCFIAFDDFLNRPHYHVVLDYFDVVENTNDKRMVILQKKKIPGGVPEDIIKKYEQIKE